MFGVLLIVVVVESTFVMQNSVDGGQLVVVLLMCIVMEDFEANSDILGLTSILPETIPQSNIIGVCFPKVVIHFYLKLCSCNSMTLA